MPERFNESDLLAYVEDQLDERSRAKLETRLARDPAVRSLVEALREDRVLLRSAPEPELPVDYLAELEPQLVRALLMGGGPETAGSGRGVVAVPPGAYRRRHRRGTRRERLTRYALAAAALIAVSAGLWAAVTFLTRGVGGPGAMPGDLTRGDGEADTAGSGAAAPGTVVPEDGLATGETWPPEGAVVHHWGPLPPAHDDGDAATRTLAQRPAKRPARGTDGSLTAGFALVVQADEVEVAEETLTRVVAELGAAGGATAGGPAGVTAQRATLVRNFTMGEAQRLFERLAAKGVMTSPPVAVSDVNGAAGGADRNALARYRHDVASRLRQLRQTGKGPVDDVDPTMVSRRLTGPRELAPDYERQLELSARGATHAIAIPAGRLAELLSRLAVDEGQSTRLEPLPEADLLAPAPPAPADHAAPASLADQAAEYAALQAALADLRAAPPDAMVLLPVRIEQGGGKGQRDKGTEGQGAR